MLVVVVMIFVRESVVLLSPLPAILLLAAVVVASVPFEVMFVVFIVEMLLLPTLNPIALVVYIVLFVFVKSGIVLVE